MKLIVLCLLSLASYAHAGEDCVLHPCTDSSQFCADGVCTDENLVEGVRQCGVAGQKLIVHSACQMQQSKLKCQKIAQSCAR